ncbi:hypothetical protein B2K_39795 [Paenibacillus mucilaginosus K02]|uniref:Uncharacterized protein n=1 Tax=Paenibacillus mucilaginosus K02 TaxID=997761 RepID=R9ULL8_9BACL|nr:hypothetical protein B2K_39795 [Paenibacillus mucilaginosus K02]
MLCKQQNESCRTGRAGILRQICALEKQLTQDLALAKTVQALPEKQKA